MRHIAIISVVFLMSCYTSVNYGRNGVGGPDAYFDASLINVKGAVVKEYNHFESELGLEYSNHTGKSHSVIVSTTVRKRWEWVYVEMGGGLGYLTDTTPGMVKGAHGALRCGVGVGTKDLGLKIGLDHRSNPLKSGSDGDIGENYLTVGAEVTPDGIKKAWNKIKRWFQ